MTNAEHPHGTHVASDDAHGAKRALRSRLRTVRRARRRSEGPTDRAEQAERLAAALLGHPAAQVDCVAVFEPLATEPPVERVTAALQERGVRVLVPHLLDDLDLDWRTPTPRDADRLDALVPPGPLLGRDAIADASLVLVPALAVDRTGARLGQGGGSYDRALTRRAPDSVLVAVVHDDEFLDEPIPVEAHDARVHAVLTPFGGWTDLPMGTTS